MAEITFEITKELGVISETAKGWTRELNLVSWNDREPKFDIRDWSPDHTRMSKGISLTEEEMEKLVELFNLRDEEDVMEEAASASAAPEEKPKAAKSAAKTEKSAKAPAKTAAKKPAAKTTKTAAKTAKTAAKTTKKK
ncbi:MAG: hypothetical protein K2J77_07030 [Oscillospiraceae bacterium]|nr:hypothetical protein [Oscillospiraceae bacterium]